MSQDDWINRDFVLSDGTTVGEALDHPGVPHDPDKYDYYVTPGATLEALMHERNMTIAEAAARCDLPATTIRGVIKAEVAITEQIAAGLEKGRLWNRKFWLKKQSNYERQKARLDKKQQAQRSRALRSAAAL